MVTLIFYALYDVRVVEIFTARILEVTMSNSLRIAVITGASSGIGGEFVRQIDCEEHYDEIWVIARRKDRLEALQETVQTMLRVMPLDLTDKDAIKQYGAALAETRPVIGLLINAAGFGKIGKTEDMSLEECDNMIDLNCRAAIDMTQASLPYMDTGSRIMEICSTAAFQPFQYLNIYAATKAFLLRYSRALRWELIPRGIIVTAVCPYWVKDTEFIGTAKKTKDSSYIKSFPLSSKMKSVVAISLHDSRMGCSVSTPSPVSTLHRFFGKVFPDSALMSIWEGLRRV